MDEQLQQLPFPVSIHGERTEKPALVFLHGFLGSKNDWQQVIPAITNENLSIAIDLPGHGENQTDSVERYSLANCAEDILTLLDKLNIKKTDIVGYSMGGRMALYFAVMFPERCNKLLLESASPGLKTEQERIARRESDSRLADRIKEIGINKFIDEWYDQPLFESIKLDAKNFESIIEKRVNNSVDRLALSLKYMGTGSMPSLWDKLPKFNTPTLLLTGEKDKKYCKIGGEMSNLCASMEHRIINNAGHNIHTEQHLLYMDVLNDFL